MRAAPEWGEFRALSELDDPSWIIYRWVLDRGTAADFDELRAELGLSRERFDQCLDGLRRLRLLRADATGLVAVRPDVAAADVVDPLERQIDRLREEADRVRENFRKLTSVYHQHRERQLRRYGDAVMAIPENVGINFIVSEIVYGGVTVVSLLHPGQSRFGVLLDQVISQAPKLRERGVSVQVVYGSSGWDDAGDVPHAAAVAAGAGCEVRVVPEIAGGAVMLRGQAAFLPAVAGGADDAVVVVREATVLEVLCGAFEQHWSAAVRLEENTRPEAIADGDEVKRRVLQLLAQGARDEMIARRIGMSVRTCRKYVAEILRETGARSRFQAGYLIGGTSRSNVD